MADVSTQAETGRGTAALGPADRAAARAVAVSLRALSRTWRIEERGWNPLVKRPGEPQIGAFWHRDILVAAALYRDRAMTSQVSRSRDGERIAAVMRHLGYRDPARGSSSRGGGAALRDMTRQVRGGTTVAFPTDGPRGPAREPKPGVVALARLSGVAITPVAISARPALRFGSWDGTLLPWPFARVVCHYGDPLVIPADCGTEGEERWLAELSTRLNALTDALDAELGLPPARRGAAAEPPR